MNLTLNEDLEDNAASANDNDNDDNDSDNNDHCCGVENAIR